MINSPTIKMIPINTYPIMSSSLDEIKHTISGMCVVNLDSELDSESVEDSPYIEDPWIIIGSYFKEHQLERFVRHQLESYNNFVGHQIAKTIEMFNPVRIVSEQNLDPISKKYSLEMYATFENFNIFRPQIHENNGAIKLMFPQEARLRNFTYAAATTIDLNIKYIVRTGDHLENTQIFYKTIPRVHIGKLPIMLKSSICVLNQYKHFDTDQTGECKYDAGGYFIINGSEKTALGQERSAENRVYCFNVEKNDTKYLWRAEIKSVPDYKCISPKQTSMMISSKNNGFGHPIVVEIPRVKAPIPLFILFRALGIVSDKDICDTILLNANDPSNIRKLHALQASVIDANTILSQEEAVRLITGFAMYTPINMDKETGAKKKYDFTLEIINNDLFPHCHNMVQKIYFLGYMANKLLMAYFELVKQDDRDSYLNKRIDLTGPLLNNLYRNYFNKLVKDMEKQIIREINTGSWRSTDDWERIINQTNIYKIIKSTTIENGLKRALSTGDFGIKHSNSNKVGVAQVLNRLNYVSSLSHLRRISTPTDKSGKLIPPRKLHGTSWGFLCPAETPEGQSVGVVKNMSYMTHITIHSNTLSLYEYILPNIIQIDQISGGSMFLFDKVKVFINGAWVGITEHPMELYADLKDKKQKGIINIYTSIIFDFRMREIKVCNDAGRLTRPVLRVTDKRLVITRNTIRSLSRGECTWDDLLTSSKLPQASIEYIDAEEQAWSVIANSPHDLRDPSKRLMKHTHCEIHPSTIFGVLASCTPFPEHNPYPRNAFQCAQGKQAMGVYVTNYENRMDKTAYILNYPMRPLVETRIMDLIQLNKIPSGSQLIVAVMTHSGYNQEDSILVNKGSIDRGMAIVTVYHTEKDEDKQKINGDEEIRCKPDPSKTKGMKMGNYGKVNSRGVIPENTLVENRDIIIAKVTPIKENRNDHTKIIKFEDQSKIHKTTEETYVDRNYIDRNGEGYNFAKVRLRTVRKPVIGDKFSSRHGQKGTVGNIIAEEDMPYTAEGLRPDIIINPHAIPSRMTIGQLIESLLGKVLIQLGLFGDGTAFNKDDIVDICDLLIKAGYHSRGDELMYNGQTGEQIEYGVFIGPVFYQRLKHMVNDKAHSRANGPMVNLTRQPAEGKSRDGGLRFGEMERDCLSYNTPVVTTNGLSIMIQNMDKCDSDVLGWDETCQQMVPSRQTGFLFKGERECIQLTYQDGRTLVCTPEHPILTYNNEWIKAKDLVVGKQKVKSSVTYPVADFTQEMRDCNGWSLQVGDITFTTDTVDNYKKTLIISKLVGYLITDGHIGKRACGYFATLYLGHMIDVNSFINDLSQLCNVRQKRYQFKNLYHIYIPSTLATQIATLDGIIVGRKSAQPAALPAFILDPSCPKPIVREFLGGMFGGDGHTCVLGMHRCKRDLLSSISFSQTKNHAHLESLTQMMEDIKMLFARFDITKITIQQFKETTHSKKKPRVDQSDKQYQLTLHLDMDELVPFHEQIGFRYCCHKSQRLEAAVCYKRLKNHVTRQHNWLVSKVDELTRFSEIKKEFPDKIVPTKKAIIQAVNELKLIEPLIHEYAIPTTHDITDHLIKGTEFGSFRGKLFPTAEEFLENIGALDWFLNDEKLQVSRAYVVDEDVDEIDEDLSVSEASDTSHTSYGVSRVCEGLPTMNLTVIDIRPVGIHPVYDIEVEQTHSFLANGIVAHNCMVSHGAARFTRGRLYDASDKYSVHACKKCGLIASYNDKMHIHLCHTCGNRSDFALVEIPYACKLLFQELNTMNVAPRLITNE